MDRERLRSFLSGVAIMLVVAALISLNGIWSLRSCVGGAGPKTGAPAPDFSLASLRGEAVRLSSLRGQVVLLDFWASWCGSCIKKMPQIERMQHELGPRGLRVLAVNVEGDAAAARGFVDASGTKLQVLLDDGTLAARYGVRVLPTLAVVDRGGRLVHVQWGSAGLATLQKRVLAALASR